MNTHTSTHKSLTSLKFLLLLALSLIALRTPQAEKLAYVDLTSPNTRTILDTLPLSELHVTLDAPYNATSTHYKGFPLLHALAALGLEVPEGSALRFVCSDGYKSVIDPAKFPLKPAFLAAIATTRESGISVANIPEGKSSVDPAPFAVVWSGSTQKKGTPWPFGIVGIEVGTYKELYGPAYPASNPAVLPGFKTFQTYCISCHSMNMQGGAVGPELNVPRNVTEYWTQEHLKGFVQNPQNYRYKSRMPAMGLPTEEVQKIYQYLNAMKNEKICSTLEECQQWEAAQPATQ